MQSQEEERHSGMPGLPACDSLQQEEADMMLSHQPQEEACISPQKAILRSRNCVVCAETKPVPEFPAVINCKHKSQVCADCYKSWIASELDNKSWKEIGCPQSGCKQLLKHAEVQRYAAPEVYAK